MMLLLIDWNWAESARQLGQIFAAFLLTLPIAWNREQADRVMGLRTFPLVAMASCGFMLLGESAFAGAPDAQARVLQGIVTGIGFIGAGRDPETKRKCKRKRHGREHLERGRDRRGGRARAL